MNPPPPMPATYGSVTPRVAAAATAASTALPPRRSTSIADRVASWSTVAAAPPVPIATACLSGCCGFGVADANGALPASDAERTSASVNSVKDRLPTTRALPRPRLAKPSVLEVLPHEAVDHTVHPLAVTVVRLPADALADEACALGVPLGALVEAVGLELQAGVARPSEQVAPGQAWRPLRPSPPPGRRARRR